jgi:hypothetical protein
MPVILSQNFDVPGGVVNGCTGRLVKVRYRLGTDGRRYATSCIIEAPDTVAKLVPELPDHHVVSLQDTTRITLKHPYSKGSISIKRTQIPLLPAFAITAHKSQGKTYSTCIVNLTGCRGTESPYVMMSRVTSLDGLVILTPFKKEIICCRQSQDMRVEFRRIRYLSLKTIVKYGTSEEAKIASSVLTQSYGTSPDEEEDQDTPNPGDDAARRVDRLQHANAVLLKKPISDAVPHIRQTRRSLTAPKPLESMPSSSTRKRKRDLDSDDRTTVSSSALDPKRQNLE